MIDILLKAKRLDNGEWIEGWVLKDEVTGQYFIHASGNSVNESDKINEEGCLQFVAFEVDSDTICRFTGLYDKNGKKIWEHDWVEFMNFVGTITYQCGCFGISSFDGIDWDKIESQILPITDCDNPLYACKNDNFISLWEIMWNFNDEENTVYTVEVIRSIFDEE